MSKLKIKTIEDFQSKGTSPEILFWVGCAGSFDDRAKRITKAFVKILNSANISFGVLGYEVHYILYLLYRENKGRDM